MIKNYWLNIVQFVGVFLITIAAGAELSSLSGIVRLFGICFFSALFIACLYEIPIKLGIRHGYSKLRIAKEVIIVWIIPLFAGYLFGSF